MGALRVLHVRSVEQLWNGSEGHENNCNGAVLTVAAIVAVLMLLNMILDQKRIGSSSDGPDPQ